MLGKSHLLDGPRVSNRKGRATRTKKQEFVFKEVVGGLTENK